MKRTWNHEVEAGPCPVNAEHTGTGVSSTQGRTRYCRCDTCGHTWKKTGPFADPLREVATEVAETLKAAPRIEQKGKSIIVIPDELVKQIVSKLEQAI